MLKPAGFFVAKYYQLILAVIALLIGLGLYLAKLHTAAWWVLGIASLAACLPLLYEMWLDIRAGHYGINVLAPTAIITALVLRQFWTAIVLVIMLDCVKIAQGYAESRAKTELQNLLAQAPQQAHVLRGRKTVDMAAADVQKNYKLTIKPGELVPVDAIILDGDSRFDESLLTGERLPQPKAPHDLIVSGSINLGEAVTGRAAHTAADSHYEQLVRLLRTASTAQAPFVRLSNRYAIPFTVTAYAIAAAAWVMSRQAVRFLDVLVVATPLPLLLAAPLALASGMSLSARLGIIVKSGKAFEQLAEAGTIAFDETGGLSRREAKASLAKLKGLGVQTLSLITTDSLAAAHAAAHRLGIDNVQTDLSPGGKLHAIEKTVDRPVVFVGDGISDTPVLTAADVGIALGARGNTAASEAADILILPDDIRLVATAVAIAKRSYKIAQRSILLGVGLSIVLMVAFATGYLPPVLGAVLQGAIDALVVFTALRAHRMQVT